MLKVKTRNLPTVPRHLEKEFIKFFDYMISEIAERFKNQGLKRLNKSTIEQFSDSKYYSNDWLEKSKAIKKKLNKQFSDERLKAYIDKIMSKADKANQAKFKDLGESLGIPQTQILKLNQSKKYKALLDETLLYVKDKQDEAINYFTKNTLLMMNRGVTEVELFKEFTENAKKYKNDINFISRNQLSNFNAVMNKVRSQELGLTKAIWSTSKDERVRSSHKDRDGKEFDISKGCYGSKDGLYLQPGEYFNCRCTAKIIVE